MIFESMEQGREKDLIDKKVSEMTRKDQHE